MKELLAGLGMLTCPVAVFMVFGNSGPGSYGSGDGVASYSVATDASLAALPGECAGCHGRQAQGTSSGPNLIDPDYGPAKRSDDQFRRAVREGMPARQGYGAMPAMPAVPERSVNRMIALVRGLQRVNGIQ